MVLDKFEEEDVSCRLVSVRLFDSKGSNTDENGPDPSPRRERERQRASRRRGAMRRASSVPREDSKVSFNT